MTVHFPGLRVLRGFEAAGRHLNFSRAAAELGVTPTHLSRVCRDCYGRSASALLRDRQMLEARRLIAYTQTGIGEIAYRLGFADAAYFTRVFTAETGQSPRAFRRAFTELPGGQ